MPTSRKNKSRNENLENFKKINKKTKKPMSTTPEIKPNLKIIKQPTWQSTELFTITGAELETLASFFAPYKDGISIIDRIIGTGELQDKIYNTILYEDGTRVPENDPRYIEIMEEDKKRIASWKELIQKRQEEMSAVSEKATQTMESIENIEKEQETQPST